jgi:hypothetical protein
MITITPRQSKDLHNVDDRSVSYRKTLRLGDLDRNLRSVFPIYERYYLPVFRIHREKIPEWKVNVCFILNRLMPRFQQILLEVF